MARTEVRNSWKWLTDAIAVDDVSGIERAVGAGARVSNKLLIHAIIHDSNASIRWLLEAGVDPNTQGGELSEDLRKDTAVAMAARYGNSIGLNELIKAGGCVDMPDGSGVTPIMFAIMKDHVGCVDLLLRAGANVHQMNANCQSLLILAANNGGLSIVRLLLRAGAKVNAADANGMTPLMAACKCWNRGHTGYSGTPRRIVDVLMKAGADVNMHDESLDTALIIVCGDNLYGRYREEWHEQELYLLIELLLKGGADVNVSGCLGLTALMQICRFQRWKGGELAAMLLDAGANIDEQDVFMCTAMMNAVQYSDLHMVAALLNRGAGVNLRNCDGKSALDLALREGEEHIAKALIFAGADVGVVNFDHSPILKEAWEQWSDMKYDLKHMCRELIRKNIMVNNPGKLLEKLVPGLGLPTILAEYVADAGRFH